MQAPLEYDHEERTRFLVEAIQHQATNAQLAQASTPPTSHAFLLALLWACGQSLPAAHSATAT